MPEAAYHLVAIPDHANQGNASVARKRTRPKSEAIPERGLTGKQLAFIDAYVGESRFNGTKAARIAGYSGTAAVLDSVARENLGKPRISGAIAARLKERHLTADALLGEIADIALGGVQDLVEIDENGVPRTDWKRLKESGRLNAVKKIKLRQVKSRTGNDAVDDEWEIEWHDKLSALDKLGKALGLWDRPPDADSIGNPLVEALRTIAGAGKKG
jgi:hypothetical protein